MTQQTAHMDLSDAPLAAAWVVHHLSRLIPAKMERGAFFQILSTQLRMYFHYDRFCINLYDSEREFLNLFTAPDGTVVESLANTRIAKNTVAGLAIASRKPVIINDLSAQDFGDSPQPLATAGLNATLALPLIMNQEVIGTLHASFVRQPENVVKILNFLLELCPVLTAFLFAVLAEERETRRKLPPSRTLAEESGLAPESSLLETADMAEVTTLARKAAKLHIPVLITGETGTGKSMLARWIHRHSARREGNFVKVNCPSLAPTLFESEMFGYAKGAFTGAHAKRAGRIELARDGTLFLDEIGEISPDMQSKLLQVMEENSFERVGEAVSIEMNSRILSATNIDLAAALADGRLRRDLFYRLSGVVVHMPPLRQRKNDIPLLCRYFTEQLARRYEMRPPRLSAAVLQELHNHEWPGNLRELRNTVSQMLLRSLDRAVTPDFVRAALHEGSSLQAHMREGSAEHAEQAAKPPTFQEESPPSGEGSKTHGIKSTAENALPAPPASLEENERSHIEQVLRMTGGRISGPRGAAALLKVPRSTLLHRIRKLNIAVN